MSWPGDVKDRSEYVESDLQQLNVLAWRRQGYIRICKVRSTTAECPGDVKDRSEYLESDLQQLNVLETSRIDQNM
ncbi:hypothetical protein BgiMline_029741 [Biomphalaria glabrata]